MEFIGLFAFVHRVAISLQVLALRFEHDRRSSSCRRRPRRCPSSAPHGEGRVPPDATPA